MVLTMVLKEVLKWRGVYTENIRMVSLIACLNSFTARYLFLQSPSAGYFSGS